MYHTKKIGVFISHIFGYYQKNVCQGIIDKALEYGYTAEIFTSMDGENLGHYDIGEESILHIPNYDSFDGIIFASESYLSEDFKHKILAKLQKSCQCPIVEIAVNNCCFPTVSIDNNLPVGELTEHLIRVHDYHRICYLGCSEERFFSDKRENCYREALTKYGRTPGTHDIFHCSYKEEEIRDALHFFCADGSPNAVVCYNDRLALSFMKAALEENIQIPNDIAITGCDHTMEGQNISPRLTTVSFPVYEVGVAAVENLIAQIQGHTIAPVTCMNAHPLIYNSCGCHTTADQNPVFFTRTLSSQIDHTEHSILHSIKMSAALQHVTDIDEGIELLENNVHEIENCREFYLCLYSDWDSVSSHILELTASSEATVHTNSVQLKLAVRNGKRLPECTYQKKYLLPEYIYDHSDSAYIYTPLYFEEKEFGYLALAFENNQLDYHFQFIQWQININQMLQRICEAKSTGLLVTRLEEIYMHDSLTELLNKHGYLHHEPTLLETAIKQHRPLCAFLIDMNELKFINDHYGHNEGDFAIQVLGRALASTSSESDICARFSGDEFYVLSLDKTKEEAEVFVKNIEKYLVNYNKLSCKPYEISCSCGFAYAIPDAGFTSENIQELFALADQRMYENKKQYHATN